jgi:hypothetical protein
MTIVDKRVGTDALLLLTSEFKLMDFKFEKFTHSIRLR